MWPFSMWSLDEKKKAASFTVDPAVLRKMKAVSEATPLSSTKGHSSRMEKQGEPGNDHNVAQAACLLYWPAISGTTMVQARPFPREEHCASSKSALSWGSHSGTKPEAVGGSVMGPARTGRKAV